MAQDFPDALMISGILSRTSLSYRMIRMDSTSVWLSMVMPPRQLLLLYKGIYCMDKAKAPTPFGKSTGFSALGPRRICQLHRHNRRACSALQGIGDFIPNKRSAKSKTIALLADAKCYTFALLASIIHNYHRCFQIQQQRYLPRGTNPSHSCCAFRRLLDCLRINKKLLMFSKMIIQSQWFSMSIMVVPCVAVPIEYSICDMNQPMMIGT